MSKKSPGIILTSQFSLPNQSNESNTGTVKFSSYFDYVKREEALHDKNNLDNEEEKELELVRKSIEALNKEFGITPKKKRNLNNDEREDEAKVIISLMENENVSDKEFNKYMDYMFRASALRSQEKNEGLNKNELEELDLMVTKSREIEDQVNNKMTDDDIIPGTFSINKDIIKQKDMKEIRTVVDQAQERGSVMWQDVISFDNDFLKEKGILSDANSLDEKKLKGASKEMMKQFIKEEHLMQPYWFASIHRNTDNVHIHFSTVESSSSRKLVMYKGETAPKGKRKQKTIDKMKTSFGNHLLEMNELYSQITDLRNNTVKILRDHYTLDESDVKLIKLMSDIDETLSDNWSGWENKIKTNKFSYKKIDDGTKEKINKAVSIITENNDELKNDLDDYYTKIDEQNNTIESLYGEKKKQETTLKSKRKEDMDERLGNAFLRRMSTKKIIKQTRDKNIQEAIEKDEQKPKEERNRFLVAIKKKQDNGYRKYGTVDKYFWKIKQKEKREIEQEMENIIYKQKQQSMNAYEKMMEDIERSKEQNQI